MRGVDGVDLPPGDYRIVPPEERRSLRDELRQSLAAFKTEQELHTHTIEWSDGSPVLEVIRQRFNDPALSIGSVTYHFLFISPDDEPLFVVERDSNILTATYTVREYQSGEIRGTIEKSRVIFGDWQLLDPTGRVRLSVDRQWWTGKLLTTKRHFDVSTPDGSDVASFTVQWNESMSLSQNNFLEVDITCSESSVPTDLCLATVFTVFRELTSGGAGGGGAGGGGE